MKGTSSVLPMIVTLILVSNLGAASSLKTVSTDYCSAGERGGGRNCELSYGLNLHASWNEVNDESASILFSIDLDWVRTDWDLTYDMATFVQLMRVKGVKVLGILGHWTMGFRRDFSLEDWAEGVRDVVVQHPDVEAWEIWNEPNIPRFHFGYMDGTPEHYVEMLGIAYAIIEAATNATVVFAGLSPYGDWAEWLARCYELGAADVCDVQGVHVYGDPAVSADVLFKARHISDKALWITEVGRPSIHGTEKEQATYLDAVLRAVERWSGRNPWIEAVFWYCFVDHTASDGVEGHFGLVRADHRLKASYFAFVQRCEGSDPG